MLLSAVDRVSKGSRPPRAAGRLALRDGIAARLAGALIGLVALMAALGALGVWGASRTADEIARAERSMTRLEIAHALEASFNRYLLREIGRRLDRSDGIRESPEAAELRGMLLTYRREVDAQITSSPSALEDARDDLLRARALASLFETVETASMLDRRARGGEQGAEAAQEFLERIAGDRDGAFRAIIGEVVADHRAEAAAAYARLDALRERLAWRGAALAAAALAGAVAFALLFHRALVRPIGRLAETAAAFGRGARGARAPTDAPGEIRTLAAQFNDMADRIATEHERLETEVAGRTADLAAANAELRRVDAARRRFFANVSHELRTPVTVLLGEARVALRGAPDREQMREALERVAGSGGYLRRRLDDLLSLARSEDGALRLEIGEADLGEVLSQAVDAARAYAAASEVTLVLDAPPDAPPVRADGQALRQAALALIDNAVKFSPLGGEVRVSASPAGDGFSVEDRGPGFGAEEAEALFDRYAQSDGGRRAGGAGLGLAVVRWIAEQHGGEARAENREGGGARVSILLPPTRA